MQWTRSSALCGRAIEDSAKKCTNARGTTLVYTAIEVQHRSARRAVDRQGGQSHTYHPFDTGSDSRSLPQSSTRGAV